MASFGSSFGSGLGGALGTAIGGIIPSSSSTTSSGMSSSTGTTQKRLSQQAIDKLVYDVLSADAGLASLATGENMSGAYGSSAKSQLAQDFATKLIGELANVTAETVTTGNTVQSSKSKTKKGTVICTELHRQGLLSSDLYDHPKAREHFLALHPLVISGYHLWALPVVERMKSSPKLSANLLPVAKARYEMVTTGRFNLLGAVTIYLGQPLCYILGAIANLGVKYGNVSQ